MVKLHVLAQLQALQMQLCAASFELRARVLVTILILIKRPWHVCPHLQVGRCPRVLLWHFDAYLQCMVHRHLNVIRTVDKGCESSCGRKPQSPVVTPDIVIPQGDESAFDVDRWNIPIYTCRSRSLETSNCDILERNRCSKTHELLKQYSHRRTPRSPVLVAAAPVTLTLHIQLLLLVIIPRDVILYRDVALHVICERPATDQATSAKRLARGRADSDHHNWAHCLRDRVLV